MKPLTKIEEAEFRAALGVWRFLDDCIKSGVPIDGLRHYADQNIVGLSAHLTESAKFERVRAGRKKATRD